MASSFAVATGHQKCTDAATEVLASGGNAVDAAIAAAFMTFIAEPVLASPLAGGFFMVAGREQPAQLLDAFVQTPRRKLDDADTDSRCITVDFGTTQQDFHCGGGTIATPGIVPGLFAAHDRFGTIPMPELAAQAVAAARQGVEITAFKAQVFRFVEAIFRNSAASRALYTRDDQLLAEGDVLTNPELGDTLEVLALEGPRFFTEGEIAAGLLSLEGSHLQSADLKFYRPEWRKPLEVKRGAAQVSLNPCPSLGGVQIALALLALPPSPSERLVARGLYEVAKLRRERDLDHHPEEANQLLLDPETVESLRWTLANHRPATRGTTHISVVDGRGLGAALTLSNGEGCGLIVPGTGIMPNNMLGEDDLVPDGPNSWHPDRRLASMMCPTVLRRGGELTLLGSGGSNRIRSAIATVLVNLIDRGMPLEEAILAPRMHVETARPNILDFEDLGGEARHAELMLEFPEATAWDSPSMFFGGVHAVQATRGHVSAAADFRRHGAAATS